MFALSLGSARGKSVGCSHSHPTLGFRNCPVGLVAFPCANFSKTCSCEAFSVSFVCVNCFLLPQATVGCSFTFQCFLGMLCLDTFLPWDSLSYVKQRPAPRQSFSLSPDRSKQTNSPLRTKSALLLRDPGARVPHWECGPPSSRLLLKKGGGQGKGK